MTNVMEYNELEILSVLEILATVANSVAVLTGFILSFNVLMRSIIAKRNNIVLNLEEFSSYGSIFYLLKSCARCGFGFQFLGWLMFSSKQIGFIPLPQLTYNFALSWAVLCILSFIFGIASRILCGKETKGVLIGERTTTMMWYAVVYFVVTFLIY